jgi:hypothetical protein
MSLAQSIHRAASSLWTPARLRCALWLDAADTSTVSTDAGLVTEWRDKSGNARHASGTDGERRPAYTASRVNGLHAVVYTPNKMLALPGFTPHYSAALVYSDASTVQYSTFLGTTFNAFDLGAYHGHTGNTKTFDAIYTSVSTRNGANFRNGTSIGDGLTTPRPTAVCVQTHVPTAQTPQAVTQLGADPAASNRSISGDYCELVLGTYAWSTLERQKLEGYLAHKWGLAGLLPADHPYKHRAPRA